MTFLRSESGGAPAREGSGNVANGSSAPTERSPLLPAGNSFGSSSPLSSVKKTFGNIVISVVGAGVLGLPYTFKQSGWLAGFITLFVVALACYYTMMLLVHTKRKLMSDGLEVVDTYSDLGLVTYGRSGQLAVDLMMILSQGGFCVGYLIFIGENLATVFSSKDQTGGAPNGSDFSTGEIGSTLNGALVNLQGKSFYIWIVFPVQIWLASIRSLTHLAPYSIVADVANFAAMAVVMRADINVFQEHGLGHVTAFTDVNSIPFVVGVAIYAYEGFGLVLPLESSMEDRSKFGKTLAGAMTCIALMYTSFAALGYFAFGDSTKDIITLNLGGSWQTMIIKCALCFGLLFTFPIMMHPVHEVLERRFTKGRQSVVVRTAIIVIIALFAVAVPHFGDFLSLVGNSVCSILSFVLPVLFHLHAFSEELSYFQYIVDYLVLIFGVVFGIWGTFTSLQGLVG